MRNSRERHSSFLLNFANWRSDARIAFTRCTLIKCSHPSVVHVMQMVKQKSIYICKYDPPWPPATNSVWAPHYSKPMLKMLLIYWLLEREKERERSISRQKLQQIIYFIKCFFILYLNDVVVRSFHTNVYYLKTDLKYFTIKALIWKYDAVKLFLITKH